MTAVIAAPSGGRAAPARHTGLGWSTPALVIGASAAEFLAAWAFARDGLPLSWALLLHALVVCVLAMHAWRLHRAERDPRAFLLFAVATAGLGPLGIAGSALTELLLLRFRQTATPFERWYESLFPPSSDDPVRVLVRQIRRQAAETTSRSTVAPFADVMTSGSVEQKHAVVSMMAEHFRPSFAHAFKMALGDHEPAVRIQAAIASARFENEFLAGALALEERQARLPDRAEVLLELARHYDDYASNGLLDAARCEAVREQALGYYQGYERRRPGDPAVAHEITRLLVRLERHAEAVQRLRPLVERDRAPVEALAWYLESLYRLERLAELRQACTRFGVRLAGSTELHEGLRQAALFWAEGPDRGAPAANVNR